MLTVEITPESFVRDICEARTFVLESEVAALKQQGYGPRVTERDLLVFGPEGVIGNELRWADECVRHKILDCVGDFALLGCDLVGHVSAWRSGHRLNQTLAAKINHSYSDLRSAAEERAA
jgi:UDP-3-O-acyl-N-acetylglucosamine deacetylase